LTGFCLVVLKVFKNIFKKFQFFFHFSLIHNPLNAGSS